jgi:hypothetical protein
VRRSRGGALAVFQSGDHPIGSIKVPTVESALRYALAADGAWARADAEHGQVYPPAKVVWTHPSNEARYLTGVLGMAGGLGRASRFLLHPFLRKIFADLGGSPGVPEKKLPPVMNLLQKENQRWPTFDLRNDREKEALGRMVLKAAQTLKNPAPFARYADLKSKWKTHREAYWVAHPMQHAPDPSVDWNRREEESLDNCLIELRGRQILFQGHQWTCPKCHHKNWVDLSALTSSLICAVCATGTQAPVDIDWLFRPNEFLIGSLRDHSVLSLIWTLSVLRERSRRSFLYGEPTWFGYSQEGRPNAEADLLVLSDGEAILCEVKSSWRDLRSSQLRDFVALAQRLRPDVALLAVMENGLGPAADIDAARTTLAAEKIRLEVLTARPETERDDPYLPGGD